MTIREVAYALARRFRESLGVRTRVNWTPEQFAYSGEIADWYVRTAGLRGGPIVDGLLVGQNILIISPGLPATKFLIVGKTGRTLQLKPAAEGDAIAHTFVARAHLDSV